MTIDTEALPLADAEQQHLIDEVEHYKDYERFQHGAFPTRCGEYGQSLPEGGAR